MNKHGQTAPAVGGKRLAGWVCLLLAVAVGGVFSRTLDNGFTTYDDPDYVTNNAQVKSGLTWAGIGWALQATHASNWHPVTWFSHMLDCTLYGLWPWGHHLTSLLLHVANTLLLFLLLSGATGCVERSAFVASVFGLHPLHVESVAWIAERKDVLSTLFWLLVMLAHRGYVKRPGVARYLWVLLLFVAGLSSKPMLVTLPLVLLLWDIWPLDRLRGVAVTEYRRQAGRLLLEKLPFLAIAGLSALMTLRAQREGASLVAIEQLPVTLRLENAALSLVLYLQKFLWPSDLAVFYPYPAAGLDASMVVGSVLILSVITAVVWRESARRPWLATGWLWFGLTLLPVIGIVQVGLQSMADRYMYVPMIGLLVALAWTVPSEWARSPYGARGLILAALLVNALLAGASWRQIRVWQDGVTLFTHALAVTRDNFIAHNNLGVALDRQGRFEEAVTHYREALRIRPGDRNAAYNYAQACFARGERLLSQEQLDAALELFREGLHHRPHSALAHVYVGEILTTRRDLQGATTEFGDALAIEPGLARAHKGLGVARAWSGDAHGALQAFEAAASADPQDSTVHYDLGQAHAALEQPALALRAFDRALQLRPGFGLAHAGRAEALHNLGRDPEAWQALTAARAAHTEPDPDLLRRLTRANR